MTPRDLAFGAILFALLGIAACGSGSSNTGNAAASASASASAVPAPPQLPGAWSELRLGMTRAELTARFVPMGAVQNCKFALVGEMDPTPEIPAGMPKTPTMSCPEPLTAGGITKSDLVSSLEVAHKVAKGDVADDTLSGLILTIAQLRSAARAGAVDDIALVAAASGRATSPDEAVFRLSSVLGDGVISFLNNSGGRRAMCATIDSGKCDDFVPSLVQRFVAGGYSLGQLDGDAHARVVNSSCHGPFLRHENALRRRFFSHSGGLAGIGLARSAAPNHTLDPDKPEGYITFSQRSKLDAPVARLAVRIANALPEIEGRLGSALVLKLEPLPEGPWSTALVWFQRDRVVRILVNLANDKLIDEAVPALEALAGGPGKREGYRLSWTKNGARTVLDLGAAMSLLVEDPSVETLATSPVPPSASASASPSATAR